MSLNSAANGRHVVHVEVEHSSTTPGAGEITLGQTRYAGLYFEEGEVARAWAVETFGRGPSGGWQRGFTVNVYRDGSTTVMSFEGGKNPLGDAGNRFEGTWQFVSGTGRFAGIEGGGTYEGESFGAMAYSNVSGKAAKR